MKQLKPYKLMLFMGGLFIILLGYILTYSHYSGFVLEYTLLTLLIFMAHMFLLPSLFRNNAYSLPVWIIFSIFLILYIGKFYILNYLADIHGEFRGHLSLLTPETAISVYSNLTASFVVFAFIAAIFYSYKKDNYTFTSTVNPNINVNFFKRRLKFLLITVTLFLIFVTYISYRYQFVMGLAKEPLPFKLEGAIVHFKLVVIPFIMISVMWFSKLFNLKSYMFIALLLFFLSAGVDVFVRASKGAFLVFFLLLLIFFWRAGYRVTGSKLLFLFICLSLALLFFPIADMLRVGVHAGFLPFEVFHSGDLTAIVTLASLFEVYKDTFIKVLMRLTGVEAFAVFIVNNVDPIGFHFIELLLQEVRGVGKYIAHNVFLVPYEQVEFYGIAPSLPGTLYLIGGTIGIVIGTAMLTWIALTLWRFLLKSSLFVAPIIQIFFPLYILSIFSEGTIERFIFHSLPFIVLSAVVVEFLFRRRFILFTRKK